MSQERQTDAAPALFLAEGELAALVDELAAADVEVIGIVEAAAASPAAAAADVLHGRPALEYRVLPPGVTPLLGPGMPRLSLKGFFLPQTEALFGWRQHGADVGIERSAAATRPRVALGVKPCDAAALEIVDHVMNWDYADDPWNERRAATTVFSLACPVEDSSCFCAAVGLAPDTARGADGLLTPVTGGWVVEPTTEKGAAFVAAHAERFGPAAPALVAEGAERRRTAAERVRANLEIDADSVRDWIAGHFDDPELAALGVRCHGCGACAFVCPTCHCFDIVDETEGVGRGTRRRLWDTCQTGKFTVHASGHNPRDDQNARFRQRVNHKFSIYPLRFGEVLCTGCGRCSRECHAGQDLVEILGAIDVAARRPEAAVAAADGGEA
ncbi:MAG: 4Fe-4S dicluster domain-containing protein [Thermoleophilia bacterium]|nr:4Fe-4S dicluster domain-containing protein [Thermoleophilia bacterium]